MPNLALPDHAVFTILGNGRPNPSVGLVFKAWEEGFDGAQRIDVEAPLGGEDEARALDAILGDAFASAVAPLGLPLSPEKPGEDADAAALQAYEDAMDHPAPSITPRHLVVEVLPDGHVTGHVTFHHQRVNHPLGDRTMNAHVDLSDADRERLDGIVSPMMLGAIASSGCELAPPPAVEAAPAEG